MALRFISAKSANQMDSRGRLSLQFAAHLSARHTFVSLPRAEGGGPLAVEGLSPRTLSAWQTKWTVGDACPYNSRHTFPLGKIFTPNGQSRTPVTKPSSERKVAFSLENDGRSLR